MGAGTVASFGLGLIKRLVRLADAPLQIVLGMDQADAGGHGAAHALGQGAEGMGSQPLAYALDAVMQGRQVAIVQQQHEFLPTEAGDYVVAPQIGAGYAGELLQHLISGGMAVEIVDALEVIQVDQSQPQGLAAAEDRKSTRLNSSHVRISYAVFCLKKKKKNINKTQSYSS